jgi:membrane protein
MTFLQTMFRELWRRVSYFARRFGSDRCSESAAALTYMSLFAFVPLLTVLYTMASAIPAFQGAEEKLQSLLFQHFVPQSGAEIEQYINDFSQQAKNLTGPGIAFLLVTAVLMLRNIEHAFNMIWRARENRSPLSSFLLYWAVLSLAPVTIGLALAISTYLSSFAHALESYDIFGARATLVQFMPLLLSTLGFSLVYAAVPNCRVPFKHALVGGLFVAVAFHAARAGFTMLVAKSSITFIYGAFAAVPLFLLWIYLSWNIVLMGCILVHSLSAYQSQEQANRPLVVKALHLLHLFWQKQQSGNTVREIELLNDRHHVVRGLDSETWGELRDLLIDRKVISQNDKGHYLLCRDLNTVPLWQLKEWIDREPTLTSQKIDTDDSWQATASQLLLDERKMQRELLATSLVDLFQR